MSKEVILIMGVGGCGSSFLWGLLGDCGFETKGINEFMRHGGVREAIKAGTLDSFEFPEVIKCLGGFLVNLNEHIDRHNWKVRHIFFVVASYDYQINKYMKRRRSKQKHLTVEEAAVIAEEDYKRGLGSGLIQLIERDHPFTMVRCPRSIKDSKYCYDQLKVVLDDMTYEEFVKIHTARIVPRYLKRLDGWD